VELMACASSPSKKIEGRICWIPIAGSKEIGTIAADAAR